MKKRIIISIIVLALLSILGFGVYRYFTKQDDNTLTVLEKQWIEENKNNMIDFEIQNDIPVFSNQGEGLIYDFFIELEKATGLEFNKISDSEEKYSFKVVDKATKNDILIYQDNYALITTQGEKYNALSDVKNLKIGVFNDDLEQINTYLKAEDISFTTYEELEELISDLSSGKTDAIVLPKTIYLNEILQNNFTIAYNITEMTKDIVVQLGENKKLNTIIKKYYSKWKKENFEEVFNSYFSNNYYTQTNVDDDAKVEFKSKRYEYGFVANAPYDQLIDGRLVGINSEIIKRFSKLAGIEVTFEEYSTNANLIKDFNANKIDFFFNTTSTTKYDMDVINTTSFIKEQAVVLTNINENIIVNTLNSLNNKTVHTISNTKIQNELKQSNIETKNYKNIEDLLNKISSDDIIVIDKLIYEMYKNEELEDYKVDYTFDVDDYYYTSRSIKENTLFNNYFDFYLSFIVEKNIINEVNYKTFETAEKLAFVKPLVYSLFAVIVLIIIALIIRKIKQNQKAKVTGVSKENKLKYIDMLTSLKNRNYLNDSIEAWDSAEIYPQAIMIIDLNNVAYINDNYGHNEGDNVIKEAANILIKNQLEQSEIIRTNGNEFLIYLVGYEEKQIVAYSRKLTKEFKELEHGFGAAIGYSMINDGLKTVDDAINEATLDMRTNKEEAQE